MPAIEFYCENYKECPLGDGMCLNAAPHLYEKCQICTLGAKPCGHNEEKINLMIKRTNFKLKLPKEDIQKLKEQYLSDGNL